jgi:hypothetical protein
MADTWAIDVRTSSPNPANSGKVLKAVVETAMDEFI